MDGRQRHTSIHANLFGGGTLLPHAVRSGWFPRRRVNVAIGVGMPDPAVWGRYSLATILAMHWWRFRRLGVRGHRSQRILRALRLGSEVTGDTALSFEPPGRTVVADAVGISLVGEEMKRLGDPQAVMQAVTVYCRRLLAEGLDIVIVPFCRHDVAANRALQQALGDRAGWLDFWSPPVEESVDRFLEQLAGLRFLVAERLHAGVLAAAAGVPFVSLPYKPKCLDFAETFTCDAVSVLPYEGLSAGALWDRTRNAVRAPAPIRAALLEQAGSYRRILRQFARETEELILAAAR